MMTEGREGNMEISKNDAYAVVAVIHALRVFTIFFPLSAMLLRLLMARLLLLLMLSV